LVTLHHKQSKRVIIVRGKMVSCNIVVAITVAMTLAGLFSGCASNRTQFEESIARFSDAYDEWKLRHCALHFLLREYAKGTDKNSPERQRLNELDSLDVHNSDDSCRIEEIYLIAFRELDPQKLTPDNEFYRQLEKRLEWIGYTGKCWHPHNPLCRQLDHFAQDVLLLGVPEIDSFSASTCDVNYPEAGGIERRYAVTIESGETEYERIPTMRQRERAKSYNRGTGRCTSGPCLAPYAKQLNLREMAEISGKLFTEIPYEPLRRDHVLAEVVTIPGPGRGNWDGNPKSYGNGPWNSAAAIVNIAAKAQPFLTRDSAGENSLTISVAYAVIDPVDQGAIDADSVIKIVHDVSGIDWDDRITMQLYTDWFHDLDTIGGGSSLATGKKDYLLGLRVTAPDGKTWEESYHLSLPEHHQTIPVYQGMLVTGREGKNPYINIPPPRVHHIVGKGEQIYAWFPVVGLARDSLAKAYSGHALVYLTPRSGDLKATVDVSQIMHPDSAMAKILNDKEPAYRSRGVLVDVATVAATDPNSYSAIPVAIPRQLHDGEYSLTIVMHDARVVEHALTKQPLPLGVTFVDLTVKGEKR